MRVTIDATPLLLKSAGVKNYLYYWIEALRAYAGADAVDAYPRIPSGQPLHHDRSILPGLSTKARIAMALAARDAGPLALDPFVAGDVFHTSSIVRQAPRHKPVTATLHDLTCWLLPHLHTPANVKADREFARRILSRAAGIVAVSENTRQDAIRLLGLSPDRITVIYPGVPEAYFAVEPSAIERVRQAHLLTRPYLLALGTIEPRKNLPAILGAYRQLDSSLQHEFDLVVAGPMGWASRQTLASLESGGTSVRYLGYVPEADLPALTAGASLFVYPSLYEGFGFPVAQAMAAGVAVITSNRGSLPEVAGDGAECVEPEDIAALARMMAFLLESPERRSILGQAGRQIATERYRWRLHAEVSWRFFERALGSIARF